MEVIIDGITYIPAQPNCADAGPLDFRKFVNEFRREMSLREYLGELLTTLVLEKEGFSGKRPFGNSGWVHDLDGFLVAGGAIAGRLDDDGFVYSADREAADALLPGLIVEALKVAP